MQYKKNSLVHHLLLLLLLLNVTSRLVHLGQKYNNAVIEDNFNYAMYEYCTVSEILSLSLINCMTSSDPRGYFGCWKSVLDMTPHGRYDVSDSVLLCRRVVGFELLLEYDRGMKTTFSATCRKSRRHDQKNLTSRVSSRVVRSEISRNFSRNISGHFPLRLHRHCRSHRQDFD